MATYTVVRGDTLDRIARRLTSQGYPVTYQELAGKNGIANPDLIDVGQVLQVPPYESEQQNGDGSYGVDPRLKYAGGAALALGLAWWILS